MSIKRIACAAMVAFALAIEPLYIAAEPFGANQENAAPQEDQTESGTAVGSPEGSPNGADTETEPSEEPIEGQASPTEQDQTDASASDPSASDAQNQETLAAQDGNDVEAQDAGEAKSTAAASISDGYFTITSAADSNKVLDAANGWTSNGTPVQIYTSNSTDAQVWHIVNNEDGTVTICNALSGLPIDIPSGNAHQGAAMQLYEQNSTAAQRWSLLLNSDGTVTIASAINRDLVLDLPGGATGNGTRVQLYGNKGTAAQKWKLTPAQTSRQQLDEMAQENASTIVDGTYRVKTALAANKTLDISAGSSANGANAQIYTENGTNAQLWVVSHDDRGYVSLKNKGSEKYLDVASGLSAAGANVQQYEPNGSWAQKWIAVPVQGSDRVRLVSALNPQLVLDVSAGSSTDGANVQVYSNNGSNAQQWNFEPEEAMRERLDQLAASSKSSVESGTYYIQSSLGVQKLLDVSAGSKSNGANVQIYSANMTTAQQWSISFDDKGYATIENVGSHKVLDVCNGSVSAGANVQQYESNGSWAQKWIIVPASGDGTSFYIRSALYDGYSLDVQNGSSSDGANVQIYTNNDTDSQTFKLVNAKPSVEACEDIMPQGWYKLGASSNDSFVVDINSASRENGATAQIYTDNGTLAQLFRFEFHDGFYLIINAQSGKALDVKGGSVFPPAGIQQWDGSATNANQLWSARANEDGTYTFVNKATGLALDIANNNLANANALDGYTPNGTAAQKFKLITPDAIFADGLYTISRDATNGGLLDIVGRSSEEGALATVNARSQSFSQKWYLSHIDGTSNTYAIECLGSGKVLAAGEDSYACQQAYTGAASQQWVLELQDGGNVVIVNSQTKQALTFTQNDSQTRIRLADQLGTENQLFAINTTDSFVEGTYIISSNANSGLVVDVASGSSVNGANIQLWEKNDSSAQKWDIWKNSDGTYLIKNAANGKALDVPSGNAYAGANVQLYQKNGSNAQKWVITYEHGTGFKICSALNQNLVLGTTQSSVGNGSNLELVQDTGAANTRVSFTTTSYTPPILGTVKWIGARHYSTGRRGNDWLALVIHISECTTLSQIDNTFLGTREASAHYGVGADAVHQYVDLNDTAWAVGNWEWNLRTVSIEHVGTTRNPPSRAVLDRSAELMAALARQKGWTDLTMGVNVGIHKWYCATSCPAGTDVRYLVSKANEYMGNGFTYNEVSGGLCDPRTTRLLGLDPSQSEVSLRDALSGKENGRGI